MQRDALGCAAAGERADVGHDADVGRLTLHVEVRAVEHRSGAGQGHSLPFEECDGFRGVEMLDEHVGGTRVDREEEQLDPADVGDGEHDAVAVVRGDLCGVRVRPRRGEHGGVGVQRCLGRRCGPRRMKDPADGVVVVVGRIGRRMIGGREPSVFDDEEFHRWHGGQCGLRLRRERPTPKLVRHHEQVGAGRADVVLQIACPRDRQYGHLDRPEMRECAREHKRLDPGRELPRDGAAGADPPRRECGGHACDFALVLCEREVAAPFVGECECIGSRTRAMSEERGERGPVEGRQRGSSTSVGTYRVPPGLAILPTHRSADLAARWRALGVWKDEPLGDTFAATARRRASKLAVVDGDRRWTYAEFDALTRRLATVWRQFGVTPGSVVTVQLPSWWETIAAIIATWRVGAIANPVLPNLRRHELSAITAEMTPSLMIVPEQFRGFDYLPMATDLSAVAQVLVARAQQSATSISLDSLVAEAEPASDELLRTLRPDPDAAALVLYTSGTTSAPKGVIHTHNTLRAEADGIETMHECTDDDVILVTMPFAHVGGMLYGVLLPVSVGLAAIVLDTWDADVAVRLTESEGVTMLPGVPVMLQGMLTSPAYSRPALKTVRLFALGGTRVTAADVEFAAATLGCWSKRSYGLTEMPTVTTGPRADPEGRLASTDGVAIGASEVRVVDHDGCDVPAGERGEILCRGPEMFLGYVDAALNESAFADGDWFRTGDIGILDRDGFLRVVDRKKDIIIRGGENISAQEIEGILLALPEIDDVALVAMPDPVLGERACAYVVFRGEHLTLADMVSHLRREGVASFKLPERLEVRTELPRNPTGKVRKDALRGGDRGVGGRRVLDVIRGCGRSWN